MSSKRGNGTGQWDGTVFFPFLSSVRTWRSSWLRIPSNVILKILKDCGHSLRGKKCHLSFDVKHSMGKKWCNPWYTSACFDGDAYESIMFYFASDWTFSKNRIDRLICSEIKHFEDFFFFKLTSPPLPLFLPPKILILPQPQGTE